MVVGTNRPHRDTRYLPVYSPTVSSLGRASYWSRAEAVTVACHVLCSAGLRGDVKKAQRGGRADDGGTMEREQAALIRGARSFGDITTTQASLFQTNSSCHGMPYTPALQNFISCHSLVTGKP